MSLVHDAALGRGVSVLFACMGIYIYMRIRHACGPRTITLEESVQARGHVSAAECAVGQLVCGLGVSSCTLGQASYGKGVPQIMTVTM